MEDDGFDYGDQGFMWSPAPSFSACNSPTLHEPNRTPQNFSLPPATQKRTSSPLFPLTPSPKKDVEIINLDDTVDDDSPPPPPPSQPSSSTLAETPTKKGRLQIPENVPFSALPDNAFGKSPTKQSGSAAIEHEFFGVYCLISRSPLKQYKNRCYIGYTVDPGRRIQQHNGGRQNGGAKKTDSRGPWDMVCIVHGFPNSVTALRFEWAWQNPQKSRRLKDLNLKKKPKESQFAFRLRIVCHMLNSDPWRRLSLTFQWLMCAAELPFPADIPPPTHMDTKYGLIEKVHSQVSGNVADYVKVQNCTICKNSIGSLDSLVRCLQKHCCSHFHTRCLAEHALKAEKQIECTLIPLEGRCPRCHSKFRWGSLVRDQRLLLQTAEVARNRHNLAHANSLLPTYLYT